MSTSSQLGEEKLNCEAIRPRQGPAPMGPTKAGMILAVDNIKESSGAEEYFGMDRIRLLRRAKNLFMWSKYLSMIDMPPFAPTDHLEIFLHSSLASTHIRLLSICLQGDGLLRTELNDYARDASPEYTCLSYAWGSDRTLSTSIPCNGCTLPITPHLKAGLRSVFATSRAAWAFPSMTEPGEAFPNEEDLNVISPRVVEPVLIWVDAICINQADTMEKAAQVTAMHEIFAQASQVIAWLGPSSEDSQFAFQHMPLCLSMFWERQSALVKADMPWQNHDILPFDYEEPAFEATARLCDRDWFHRMWMVQEIVGRGISSGFDILCGTDRISGDVLLELCHLMLQILPVNYIKNVKGISRCSEMLTMRRTRTSDRLTSQGPVAFNGFSPLELIHVSRNREVTEPVDRLYAVRGLLSGPLRSSVKVDYSESNRKDLAGIACEYTILILILHGFQWSHLNNNTERTPSIPTWAIDIFRPQDTPCFSAVPERWRAGIEAGTDRLPGINYFQRISPTHIEVYAVHIDNVLDVHSLDDPQFELDVSQETRVSYLIDNIVACFQLSRALLCVADISLIRTLVADTSEWKVSKDGGEMAAQLDKATLADVFGEVLRVLSEHREQGKENVNFADVPTGKVYAYMTALCGTWPRRAFFTTEKGSIGLCSMKARKGDPVVIIKGDRMVQVVQTQDDGSVKLTPGAAYLHDYMEGEIFDLEGFKERGWLSLCIS